MHAHMCKDTHIYKNRYANAPSYTPRYTNNAKINKYMQMSANTQVCTYANIFKCMQTHANVHKHTLKDLQCYTDVRP